MPKGPKGEKRPADVVGAAVMVARIATGEIEDSPEGGTIDELSPAERRGYARADKLSKDHRTDIARAAARRRWHGSEQ